MIPENIGRYEIKGVFGEGGMATVYRAFDPRFEREVALKMLHDRSLRSKDNRARFLREGRIIAKLDHPCIVPVYDIGEEDDRPYLVMRFMSGGSLNSVIRREPMSLERITNVVERIGSALDEAHAQGIVHRDLKPANILLDQRGDVFLSDFGIVKTLVSGNTLTSTGTLLGTLAYMSPEQLQGRELDGRSDIYSLGVVLFQMVTGQLPFRGTSDYEVMMAHIQQAVPAITDTRADLPFTCQTVINKAMEKNPENRYTTASEMTRELKTADFKPDLRQDPITATQTAVSPPDSIKPPPSEPEVELEQLTTSAKIKHQINRLPMWAKAGMVGVGLVLLFGILFQVMGALNAQRGATGTPTVETVAQTLEIPATTVVIENIIVRDWDNSAIWQVGEEMARIPAEGKLPLQEEPILIQSNAAPMELLLPDRTRLVLDTNTSITLDVLEKTAVTIQQGRLGIEPVGSPVPVNSATGIVAQTNQGLMGITFDANQTIYTVDCLQGVCELIVPETDPVSLNEGERRIVTQDGISEVEAAQFEPFVQLFNRLPAPTAIAIAETATTAQEPTTTDAPSPTNTIDTAPPSLEFGQSAAGNPLEMVQFGDGPRHIMVVGGTHGGYAPNTVALAEEFIDYFAENQTAVPADVTLTIIPNFNPDAAQTPEELSGRLNGNGVDLNRNWDCRWIADPIVLGEKQEGVGGTEAESEPEVQALADFFREQQVTAVIQIVAHGRDYGIASPGSCLEPSRVSVSLSKVYGTEASYLFANTDEDALAEPDEDLTGDMTNWLDSIDIPAISVLLPGYEETDFELNLQGLTAVLQEYTGPETSDE